MEFFLFDVSEFPSRATKTRGSGATGFVYGLTRNDLIN